MKDTKWIEFHELPTEPGKKTRLIWIVSRSSGETLGYIKWWSPWRQYTFYPERSTVWNDGCLKSVIEKMQEMMKEHRA